MNGVTDLWVREPTQTLESERLCLSTHCAYGGDDSEKEQTHYGLVHRMQLGWRTKEVKGRKAGQLANFYRSFVTLRE